MKKRSNVVQRSLPRPTVIDKKMFANCPNIGVAENLIREEMLVLLAHDNRTHPQKGMKASQLPQVNRDKAQYSLDEIQRARDLIDSELGNIVEPDHSVWESDTAMYFK